VQDARHRRPVRAATRPRFAVGHAIIHDRGAGARLLRGRCRRRRLRTGALFSNSTRFDEAHRA
jgi:hypothetical protein